MNSERGRYLKREEVVAALALYIGLYVLGKVVTDETEIDDFFEVFMEALHDKEMHDVRQIVSDAKNVIKSFWQEKG